MRYRYTTEQMDFLRNNIYGRTRNDAINLFNERYGILLSREKFKNICQYYKLKGYVNNTCFEKGVVPHNKGKIRWWKSHQFEPNSSPWNTRDIGSERTVDGIIIVKVSEPNIWRSKHSVIWENANSKIPENHVVIFADGDRNNFNIDNLLLVSRAELMIMNKRGLTAKNTDLTKVGKAVAGLHISVKNKMGQLC